MMAFQKALIIEENKIELTGQTLKQLRKYLIVPLQRKKFYPVKINLKYLSIRH